MGKMQREKGKRGEREFAALCKKHGFDEAKRTAQYCGKTGDAADCTGLNGIHIEVKRVEKLNLLNAMEQAKRDCKAGNIPIVAHRKNNCEWQITMTAESWFEFYKAWSEGK